MYPFFVVKNVFQ